MNTVETFVNSLIMATTEGREPMTYDDAFIAISEWIREGRDLPKDLTARKLADLWNDGIKDKPMHRLTFYWKTGSAADNMIAVFKAARIPWRYGSAFNLQANLDGSGFVNVEYYKIAGDVFGIIKEPPRTSEYFGIPAEELWQESPDADGYTREDRLILDNTEEESPWSGSLLDAVEKAEYYRRAGYEDVTILRALCSCNWYRYYVLAARYNPARRAC